MKSIHEIVKIIDLQEEVASLVISAFNGLNIKEYDEYIQQLLNIQSAPEARNELIKVLEPDPNNIKMLTCMLYGLSYTYEKYQQLGISDEIYASTMKCFTRFIQERWNGYHEWSFDRDWWSYRQIAMTIFRLGELEYEMKNKNNEKYISLHIPSDANLLIDKVCESLFFAQQFFKQYFSEYSNVEYRCHSWLLSPALKKLLPPTSNILKFQSLFTIINEDYSSSGYIEWVYKRKYQDYRELPENTTLQRNLKQFLISGNLVSIGLGILKNNLE